MGKLPGFQTNIESWLQRFDIFAMSSIREGQPLVLLEAMSYRLPIVATKVGGIPETIKNGKEAILVDPGNPFILSSAIISLLKNNNLKIKIGRKAEERVKKDFSVETICRKYEQLYSSLVSLKRFGRCQS